MNTVKFKPSKRAVGVSLIVLGFVLAVTSPAEASRNNWQYAPPTSASLTVEYPSWVNMNNANHVNVRLANADTGQTSTLNWHWGTPTPGRTRTVVFAEHGNWPGWDRTCVVWVQVAETNYHWSGRVCDDPLPPVTTTPPVEPPVTTLPPVEPPVTTLPPVQPPVTTLPPVDGCFITDTRTWLPEGSYEVPGDQTGTTRFHITPCGLPVVLPPPAVPPVTTVPHKHAAEVPAADCCCGAPSLVIL